MAVDGDCRESPEPVARTMSKEMSTMNFRIAILAGVTLALTACTTSSAPSNPLQVRWNGKSADVFFAAYGPPLSDRSGSGGATVYSWRGGFVRGKSCTVELDVSADYKIKTIRAISDRPDPKGGPTHCERVLDAD